MYKIYINENCLLIANKNERQLFDKEDIIVVPFLSGKKYLLNYIDKLEKSRDGVTLALIADDDKELFQDYRSLYKVIEAAGGLWLNKEKQILFIERLGYWDLPKGKVDKGETKVEAAVREVAEETGQHGHILDKLGTTWHTYYDRKERRILKKTFWYTMNIDEDRQVRIQREENITDFRWMTAVDFLAGNLRTYQSIIEIVQKMQKSPKYGIMH